MFWLFEWLLIMKKLYLGITGVLVRTSIYIIILVLALPFVFSVNLDYRYIVKTASYTCATKTNVWDGSTTTFMNCNPSENGWMLYNFSNQSIIGFTITGINISSCGDGTGASYPWKLMMNCTLEDGTFSQQLFNVSFNGANDINLNSSINITNSNCFGARFTWYQVTAGQNIYCAEVGVYGTETVSSGGTAPSLTLNSDLKNGTITNATYYNFFFNGSSTNNSNFYNCDIFAGITNKGSGINLNLTKNNNFSFSLPNTEQYINFTLNCYNENASKNTSALYYIDNIKTVLDWLSPNGTYYNNVQLYTNFSISDDNLYFFEYTVYQGVTLKENITHSNLHGINNYSVYNLSGVSQIVGSYTWNLKVWENHNPLSDLSLFKEYSTKINNSKITYSYNNKEYSIYSNEKMFIISQTKDYKQYFNFLIGKNDTPKTEYTYYLEYDGELIYISDSKYKGHFVLWDIKRYVDFQCKDYVKVTMINKNKYQINTPCTNFETTGNLNFMSWSGNFTITTPPSLSDAYLSSINETLYNSYIIQNNIWGEIKMFSLILINIVFIGICVWFAKNFHKRAILLVLSPLVNLTVIFMDYFNIESSRLSNTGIQIIATGMFIVSILILGLLYVLIPAKEMKKQQADVYSELVYNQK